MSMPSLDPDETQPARTSRRLRLSRRIDRAAALDAGTVAAEEPAAAEVVAAAISAEPARDGWTLIALVPYDGQEPPADVE